MKMLTRKDESYHGNYRDSDLGILIYQISKKTADAINVIQFLQDNFHEP